MAACLACAAGMCVRTAAASAPGGKTEEGDWQTGKWGTHKLGLDDFDLLKVGGVAWGAGLRPDRR